MSEQQYYVRIRGRVGGPFTLAQLQTARNNGKLLSAHEVSTDQEAWKPAYEYPEVFGTEGMPSSPSRRPIPFADETADGVPATTASAAADLINFDCPHCGAPLRIPAQFAGRKGQCKTCGHAIHIPEFSPADISCTCSMCGERIKAGSQECPYCGERQECNDVNMSELQAYTAPPELFQVSTVIKQQPLSKMERSHAQDNVNASASEEAHTKGLMMSGMVYCRGCGTTIHESAISCPHCGARQRASGSGKNKIVAGLLALFLGGFGIHRFYLGQWWGLFYLLFFWTFIPAIIAFVEALVFFFSSDRAWEEKYG